MRIDVVDPSAFTPPYDNALCAALARAGADVRLVTSAFAYGDAPALPGYRIDERFYRFARGGPGSQLRRVTKALEHVPDMLAYGRAAAGVAHFQWLPMQWIDGHLLPRKRKLVLTTHDLLPREARPGQAGAQRRLYERVDAVVVHSDYGRSQLVDRLGVDPGRVHVIHHGAFDHLAALPDSPLPPELARVEVPVVLFFGLLRPYKGLDAARGLAGGTGRRAVGGGPAPDEACPPSRPTIRVVPRFVSDLELPALFRRADVVVLPYTRTERLDFSGVLATALAFGARSLSAMWAASARLRLTAPRGSSRPPSARREVTAGARRARPPRRRGPGRGPRPLLLGRGGAQDDRGVSKVDVKADRLSATARPCPARAHDLDPHRVADRDLELPGDASDHRSSTRALGVQAGEHVVSLVLERLHNRPCGARLGADVNQQLFRSQEQT